MGKETDNERFLSSLVSIWMTHFYSSCHHSVSSLLVVSTYIFIDSPRRVVSWIDFSL